MVAVDSLLYQEEVGTFARQTTGRLRHGFRHYLMYCAAKERCVDLLFFGALAGLSLLLFVVAF